MREWSVVGMDAQDTSQAIAEGSKALTKLHEIILKLVGPISARKQANADAYAIEKMAQVIRQNADMDIEKDGDTLKIKAKTEEALLYRAEQRRLAAEIQQEENIESIIKITGDELKDAAGASEEPIDDDWLVRFFRITQDISSAELQCIWGKILADEIKRPGSYSFRTLETVRNLDKRDAMAFQKLLPFIVSENGVYYLSNDFDLLRKYGIEYSDILLLDDCGLVNSDSNVTRDAWITGSHMPQIYERNLFMTINHAGKEPVNISIGAFLLTRAGQELFKTLDYSSNDEYFIDMAKLICENNQDVKPVITVFSMNTGKQEMVLPEKETNREAKR